ncbi:MAG: hypothetical protein HY557_08575, partial [Euryarchaeota archaeon]|nr:hypothetical protein [Euryarchaeota archaeon]
MRRSLAALLAAMTLVPAFAAFSALPTPPSEATRSQRSWDYGPHLMLPNPDAYPRAPFVQPPDWTGTPPLTRAPSTRAIGTQRAIIVLIEFQDVRQTTSSASIGALVNNASPGAASVRNYYDEISYGLLGVSGSVTPWVRSSYPMSEYGADSSASQFDDAN